MKKPISEKMLAVWSIMFALVCVAFGVYRIVFLAFYGHSPNEILGGFHIAVTVAMSAFFFPMLLATCFFAKKEKNKAILIATGVLLGILTPWMAMNAITILRELKKLIG